jgi:hypothetical protein
MALSNHQINGFAGNAIELSTGNKRILAISTHAAASLSQEQKESIEESTSIVELPVQTIERADGSLRMLAGIHLARKYWPISQREI